MVKAKSHSSPKDQSGSASQSLESIQRRKDDTRKKILVGAYIIDKHLKNGTTELLLEEMDIFLSRKQDRELFNLH